MSADKSNKTIAIVCSLCEYFAPSEFDLQIHFDYNHPQILDEANTIRQVKVTSPKIKVEQVAASKLFESPPKPTFDSKLSLETSLGMDFKSASNPTENGIKLKVEYFSDHSFSATSPSTHESVAPAENLDQLPYQAPVQEEHIVKQEENPAQILRSKGRRPRIFITEAQRVILKTYYSQSKFADLHRRRKIGKLTGLEVSQVQFWFQNLRQKEKSTPVRSEIKSAPVQLEKTTTLSDDESASSSPKKRRTSSAVSYDPLSSSEQDDERMSESLTKTETEFRKHKITTYKYLTEKQKIVLKELYDETNFPDFNTRQEIGSSIGLESRQVQIWFQNQRQREKSTPVRSEIRAPGIKSTPVQAEKKSTPMQPEIKSTSVQLEKNSTLSDNESASSSSKKRRTSSALSFDPLSSGKQDDESMSESLTKTATRFRKGKFIKHKYLTEKQKIVLKELYDETNFPDLNTRQEIGSSIGLKPRQVQIWFQNMRSKERNNGTYQERPLPNREAYTLRNRKSINYTDMIDSDSTPCLSSKSSDKTHLITTTPTKSNDRATNQTSESMNTNFECLETSSDKPIDLTIEESPAKTSVTDSEDNLLIDFMHQAERLRKSLKLSLTMDKTSSLPSRCDEDMETSLEKYQLIGENLEDNEMQISEVILPENVCNEENIKSECSEIAMLKEPIKDMVRKEDNLCNEENRKIEYSEVATLKEQIKDLERNQCNIMSNNTDLTTFVTLLKDQIKDLVRHQGKLISKNEDLKKDLSKAEEKASSDMKSFVSDITSLESEIAKLNKQHTFDVKTIDEAKDAINNISDKLKSKNAELSQAKLSHERSQLELNKQKSSSFQADVFKQIRRTLKLTLENDSEFCKTEQEWELSDSDVLEYINSILLEFQDIKKRHFVDVRNCISQFEKFQIKKEKYKNRKQKLTKENEDLKSSCEEKDILLSQNKQKLKALKQQLKDKIKAQEDIRNQKDVKKLQKQVEEKELKIDDMVVDQKNLEAQIETQNVEIKSLQKAMQKLETEKGQKMYKSEKSKLTYKSPDAFDKQIATKDKIIKLLTLKNADLTRERKEHETRLKNVEFPKDEIENKEELILTLERSILMLEKKIATQEDNLKTCNSSSESAYKNKSKINQLKAELNLKEEVDFVVKLKKNLHQPITNGIKNIKVER